MAGRDWAKSLRALALAAAFLGEGAFASESLSELATGGLVFSPAPPGFVVESEETTVSTEAVAIRYRLNNTSQTPIEISIGYRLPDLDFSDPDISYAIPAPDPVNFLNASMRIDNNPAPFTFRQRAFLAGKDVTETLKRAKLALVPVGTFQTDIAAMAPPLRDELAQQNLIRAVGTNVEGSPLFFPAWDVRTDSLRKLKLEPAKSVEIALRYVPSVGITRDTVLRKALRDQKGLAAQIRDKRSSYCIDDAFLNGVDALAGTAEGNTAGLVERRMKILLRPEDGSGLPAAQYRLIVDKGKPQRIVSFCWNKLRKISPSAFEADLTNASPKPVFDILFIEKGG